MLHKFAEMSLPLSVCVCVCVCYAYAFTLLCIYFCAFYLPKSKKCPGHLCHTCVCVCVCVCVSEHACSMLHLTTVPVFHL